MFLFFYILRKRRKNKAVCIFVFSIFLYFYRGIGKTLPMPRKREIERVLTPSRPVFYLSIEKDRDGEGKIRRIVLSLFLSIYLYRKREMSVLGFFLLTRLRL